MNKVADGVQKKSTALVCFGIWKKENHHFTRLNIFYKKSADKIQSKRDKGIKMSPPVPQRVERLLSKAFKIVSR